MSNVASRELSEKLYELSGWRTGAWHTIPNPTYGYDIGDKELDARRKKTVPKYDLSYTLHKLPPLRVINDHMYWLTIMANGEEIKSFIAAYCWMPAEPDGSVRIYQDSLCKADTPADAVALLAIKLFEEEKLTKAA